MELNIGSVILELRKKQGITQERLAELVGVSTPAVSKWETNTSCPDVALLSPIARALDTDVNTLLSFTPTLSLEELAVLLKELRQMAGADGAAALQRMTAAVCRYPGDTTLRYQLACMAFSLSAARCWAEAPAAEARRFAEANLEFVREHGQETQRFLAAYMLAALLLNDDELDRAEALLNSLPNFPMSPRSLYIPLYQKRGDSAKARLTAQGLLATGAATVLNSLLILASPKYGGTAEENERAFQAQQAVANTLGYPQAQTEVLRATHLLELGQTEQALDRLLSAACYLAERQEAPRQTLWGSGVPQEEAETYRLTLGRLLRENLAADPVFDGVRQDPRYLEALEALTVNS